MFKSRSKLASIPRLSLKTAAFLPVAAVLAMPVGLQSVKEDPYASLKRIGKTDSLSRFKAELSRFKPFNLANATAGGATANVINGLRGSIGMVVGYSDHAAYVSLVCGGTDPGEGQNCDGPPQNGIVGALTSIVNDLPTIGQSAGVTSCESIPSSGSISGKDSDGNTITLTFQTPTHTVPADWSGGGATFQKRVAFTTTMLGEELKIATEFNCGDSPMYTAVNMAMDNQPGYSRLMTIYSGAVSASKNGIEVYMAEYNATASKIRAADAVRIEYVPSSETYQLWGVMSYGLDSRNLDVMGRAAITGNYVTGQASVYYDSVTATNSGNGIDGTSMSTAQSSTYSSYNLSTTTNHDFTTDLGSGANAGDRYQEQGCVDFSSPNTTISSHTLCSGLALSSPASAPYIDSSGHFSISWALTSMASHLETL